jgi:hypothetical protein
MAQDEKKTTTPGYYLSSWAHESLEDMKAWERRQIDRMQREMELERARKIIDQYTAIRDNQIEPEWAKKLREQREAETAPQSPAPATEPQGKKKTSAWVGDAICQMLKDKEISADIKITHLAEKLEERMAKAADKDRSIRAVSARYIKNELPGWGYWPLSKIKI